MHLGEAKTMIICDVGFAARPLTGIPPCGDGWHLRQERTWTRLMLADGLGHGRHAHQLVSHLKQQLEWIEKRSTASLSPEQCIEELHHTLKKGGQDHQAATALVQIDTRAQRISSIIIGNIDGYLASKDGEIHIPASHGMLGGRLPSSLRATTYSIQTPSLLLLCSDGIEASKASRTLKQALATLNFQLCRAEEMAQSILEQCGKSTDDASCIVVRLLESGGAP